MQPMDLQGLFKYVAGRLFPRLTAAQGATMLPSQPEGVGYYESDTDSLLVKTQNPTTTKEVLCATKTGASGISCTGALALKTTGAGTGASLSAVGAGSTCSMVSDGTCTVRSDSAGVVVQGGTTATVTGGTDATLTSTIGNTTVESVAGSANIKALAAGQDATFAAEEIHCLPGTAGGGGFFLHSGTLAVLTADALTHVEGALVYVTDGRKFGEGAGTGTGLPGFWSAAGGGAFYDYAGNAVTV